MAAKMISMDEVARHNNENDCWVVIHGKVCNLTPFLDAHPGGAKVLTNQAGRDGTSAFEVIHPKDILKQLPSDLILGDLDPATVRKEHTIAPTETETKGDVKPTLDHMINVFDLECVAQGAMKKEGWAYYSSAADDEITLRENRAAFHRIWFRPRVLVNVKHVDMSCTMMGTRSNLPIYVSATALGKLAHPDGEVAITRACQTAGTIQMIPTLASCSLSEMLAAKGAGQTQWFQLYVNSDKKLTAEVIKKAEAGGCTALAITVDAPQLGRRERDMRNKILGGSSHIQKKTGKDKKQSAGITQALTTFIDPSLCWADIPWFQSLTNMKIMIKGIQCGEDAVLAYKAGVPAIIVSNHGGRQLDFSRSGVEVLAEVMDALKAIGAEKKIEVYVDGGIRRGTDVFKALALGARGVGIGRPVLHGLAAYGQEGVERVFEIFHDELRMCMSLMGTPTIGDIRGEMIDTRSLHIHPTVTPQDHLSTSNYTPLPLPINRSRL